MLEAAAREGVRLGLVLIFARAHQQVEAHVVVEQHAPLRNGNKKAELHKDKENRHEDAGDRERRTALVIRQNAPGKADLHLLTSRFSEYSPDIYWRCQG